MALPTFAAALAIVLDHAAAVSAPSQETVALEDALHRVLAADVHADRDQPPFDRSTRDGFALRATDALVPRRVIGTLAAGQTWPGPPLAPGEAIEIMTGAPMPAGADAVVMVEHTTTAAATRNLDSTSHFDTTSDPDTTMHLDPTRTPTIAQNIVRRGSEAQQGSVLLAAGTLLSAAEIAVAATCGQAKLRVYERPRVAILATGDELVELEAPMLPAQIRNSNSYALAALVRSAGGDPLRLAAAPDNRTGLRDSIAAALAAGVDLLLLSGGVSMGKYDLVEQVLAEDFAARFHFTGARIQPGKPIVFGTLTASDGQTTPFFGLPGNPVSTQLTFAVFVAPLLRARAGRTEVASTFTAAQLAEDVAPNPNVTRFLPAQLTSDWQSATVRPVGWQGSGDSAANARGNCYVVLPAQDVPHIAGTPVRILLR